MREKGRAGRCGPLPEGQVVTATNPCDILLAVNTRYRWFHAALLLTLGALLFSACPAGAAVRPDQLILVVNKTAPEGLRIARYYMEKRRVPLQNMVLIGDPLYRPFRPFLEKRE